MPYLIPDDSSSFGQEYPPGAWAPSAPPTPTYAGVRFKIVDQQGKPVSGITMHMRFEASSYPAGFIGPMLGPAPDQAPVFSDPVASSDFIREEVTGKDGTFGFYKPGVASGTLFYLTLTPRITGTAKDEAILKRHPVTFKENPETLALVLGPGANVQTDFPGPKKPEPYKPSTPLQPGPPLVAAEFPVGIVAVGVIALAVGYVAFTRLFPGRSD